MQLCLGLYSDVAIYKYGCIRKEHSVCFSLIILYAQVYVFV